MAKIVGTVLGFCGFLLLLGTAGADCDGKCMENSLSLSDIALYVTIGLTMMGAGAYLAIVKE